jgi:uncharacterized protein (TIGR03083 family)
VDTADLRTAAAACADYLRAWVAADWTVPIPAMDWTVGQAVAHIGDGLLWYATDFVGGPVELSTMDLAVRPVASPSDLVRTLETFAEVLARALDGAVPGDVGWHSAGHPDAVGFAAMACDELLVHTLDAAAGLGHPFNPPPDVAARTVARLFPEAPTGHDPVATLLWANGRVPLGDVPQRTSWKWHCAPLPD